MRWCVMLKNQVTHRDHMSKAWSYFPCPLNNLVTLWWILELLKLLITIRWCVMHKNRVCLPKVKVTLRIQMSKMGSLFMFTPLTWVGAKDDTGEWHGRPCYSGTGPLWTSYLYNDWYVNTGFVKNMYHILFRF